jgi:hypothetical protein
MLFLSSIPSIDDVSKITSKHLISKVIKNKGVSTDKTTKQVEATLSQRF